MEGPNSSSAFDPFHGKFGCFGPRTVIAVGRAVGGSRLKAGVHDRLLSGDPVQLQLAAVRGIRLRAFCDLSLSAGFRLGASCS